MRETVIVGGARTPFGKFGGALQEMAAVDLGGIAIQEAIRRSRADPQAIEHVVMGMVLQSGAGQVPSRQAARRAGLDWPVTSETINKVCASGMRSITLADQMIRSGDASLLVVGGMESMSQAPYLVPQARWGSRMGDQTLVDSMLRDGLTCPFHGVHMVNHGSQVAAEFRITRGAQDAWALRSHERAIAAMAKGYFAEEIVPVRVVSKQGERVVDRDEGPRSDTSLAKLAALSPVFDSGGTITAGNAPGVNDGAAALVVMDKARAHAEGLTPLATIVGHATVGERAPYIAMAPALAVAKLLNQAGMSSQQIDRFEVNEAFAAVLLTCEHILGWERDRVNVNGGAIALGHPIGASGTRIVLTLINELRRHGGGYGIAAICSGTAQGDAILVRVDV
ncbi:acetyl-CoA C-acetyltransferase [Paenibacillus roseipurpureus]|uniref:acetyl-CoA C-acetyltransferase n=1 Tax=Paenibacillus roseopurpureus TaxID=2918901 RepID=A0AA96LRK7_9BACL|nr:acetyl-CoA C-acetyltransferase [Paenibacillus sp. MBLB1832]WNR46770.1 acetyl-CoA C-acetyltransferase [Paenibacillus sp. MBLB1832]